MLSFLTISKNSNADITLITLDIRRISLSDADWLKFFSVNRKYPFFLEILVIISYMLKICSKAAPNLNSVKAFWSFPFNIISNWHLIGPGWRFIKIICQKRFLSLIEDVKFVNKIYFLNFFIHIATISINAHY